ncbi:MAG: glycosyltransferase [Bulleidia sp.]|nr:glycosyltransferase [Bulleidia sp.]
MTRILYVLSNEPTGGVGTVIRNYVTHFDSRVTIDYLIYTAQRNTPFQKEVKKNGEIYYLPELSLSSMPSLEKQTKRFFREHGREYSAVHLHFAGIAPMVMKPAMEAGIPCRIMHSHNTKLSDNALKSSLFLQNARHGMKYCTHFFACGKEAGRFLYGNRNDIFYMHNAIDPSVYAFQPAVREQYRKDHDLSDKHVYFSVGRLEKQKNLFFALDILQAIAEKDPDAVYLIAGVGPLKEELEKKVQELHLNDKVFFLGFTDQVPYILQAADLLLFPSLYEGLPLTLVEAQCAGLPALVSDKVTDEVLFTELCHVHGLAESPQAWAEAAMKIVSEQKRFSHEPQITLAGYNITMEAKRIEDFYLSLGEAE